MNVGIYIYENAEVLDFSGPFEVFSTANRLVQPGKVFDVFLVAEQNEPVQTRGGFSVNPHYSFNNHPELDVLIVAGGVHCAELNKPEVLQWVKSAAAKASTVASVCTGAFILAEAGLLDNRKVTTHWEDIKTLKNAYPGLMVLEFQRWVEDEKYVTSGGISAGIDMSLYLVSKLVDINLAEKTAKQMEFDWRGRSG